MVLNVSKPVLKSVRNSRWEWTESGADPGFPVVGEGGGTNLVRGGTDVHCNAGAFWQKFMQKRKNWVLLGGGTLDPPMRMHGNKHMTFME